MADRPRAWTAKAMSAVVVVLTVAVGARVAWWLLAPLMPVLVVMVGLGVVFAVGLGRFRR